MVEFGIKDFLDILLVASLLFYVYRLMKESRSLNIFVGIMLFVLIWLFVSQILEMRLLGSILDKLVSVGVIALIVIFQEDIRRFLYEIGSQKGMRRLVRFFHSSKESQKEANKETIMPIVMACMSMAKKYVGALIVIERGVPLKDIMDTGEEIDAKINQRLIENIFFKNSPLHDGAMVVSNKRIMAAGCILPVSHNLDIPKELGLRHRAALGISQSSDAIAVIVSEETGRISVAIKGEFKLRLSAEELESDLYNYRFLGISNIMALRGDSITGEKRFVPHPEGYAHANELVEAIRHFDEQTGESFCIGVGGYPEKHFECANIETDIENLKRKVDAGADYIITQMFFDNKVFYRFVDLCRKAGINVPIIPGLKPISTARQVALLPQSFSLDIPKELTEAIAQAGYDKEEVYRIGTQWCTAQCKDLLAHGVPAVHFYTMGKPRNITEIMRECF